MSLDFDLQDAHVLVTGASGGIGIEITRHFLQLGAKVSAQYNTSPKDLASLASPNLAIIQADVTSESAISTLFDAAQAHHSNIPVQILIANHGIWPTEPVEIADMTLSQWRNTHAVNLDGSFLLCREFLRRLRQATTTSTSATTIASSSSNTTDTSSGASVGSNTSLLDRVSICFIGSTAGKFGEADHGDYASTKAALMYGLTTTLKNEIVRIAPRGRVNSINPGWVKTPMAEEATKDAKFMARALTSTPLRKIATPSDVARQVVAISSPALSGHVTGVNVMVDGGMEGRCLYPPGE